MDPPRHRPEMKRQDAVDEADSDTSESQRCPSWEPGDLFNSERAYNNRFKTSMKTGDKPTPAGKSRRTSRTERRVQSYRMAGQGGSSASVGEKPIAQLSVDSLEDDVFLDKTHSKFDMIHERLSSQRSTDSILPNPFNKLNHRLHRTLWCPCCLFFFFICCIPGIFYMQKSDKEYTRGFTEKARRYGRVSSIFFFGGILLTLILLTCVFFLIIYFNTNDG